MDHAENGVQVLQLRRSQFSEDAISACTVLAAEAALRVLLEGTLTPQAAEEVVSVGTAYKEASHCDVREVVEFIPRYSVAVREVSTVQGDVATIGSVVKELGRRLRDRGVDNGPVAAILTKPPESVMVAVCPDNPQRPFLIFDSHPRPHAHPNGAAVTFCRLQGDFTRELQARFPSICMDENFECHAMSYNMYELNFIEIQPALLERAANMCQLTGAGSQDLYVVALASLPALSFTALAHLREKERSQERTRRELSQVVADAKRWEMECFRLREKLATYEQNLRAMNRRQRLADAATDNLPPSRKRSDRPEEQKPAVESRPVDPLSDLLDTIDEAGFDEDGTTFAIPTASPVVSDKQVVSPQRKHTGAANSKADNSGGKKPGKSATRNPNSSKGHDKGISRGKPGVKKSHGAREPPVTRQAPAHDRPGNQKAVAISTGSTASTSETLALAQELETAEQQVLHDMAYAEKLQRAEQQAMRDYELAKELEANFGAFECIICTETLSREDVYTLKCRHEFCRQCIQRSVQTDVLDKALVEIRCPQPDCEHVIPQAEVLDMLDNNARRIFLENQTGRVVESDTQHFIRCTQPDCAGLAFMEPENGDVHFVCPSCDHERCIVCNFDWHGGMSCEEHKQAIDEAANPPRGPDPDMTIEEARKHGLWRCHRCTILVERKSDCNAVRCRCGGAFCDLCGGDLSHLPDPHDHFNMIGTPCYGKLFEGVYRR